MTWAWEAPESAQISGTLSEECGGCLLSQMQNDPQSMAILNSTISAMNNPTTYVEWYGFSAVGGSFYAAPEVIGAVIEAGQYAEATVPGLTESAMDIMNVGTPIPSNAGTWAGLAYNGWGVVSSLWNACFGGGNCIKDAWNWFNGHEVNAPYMP